MPVGIEAPQAGSWLNIPGFRLATGAAAICYSGRDDLLLVELPENATTAAVFTRNQFCAAPVQLAKSHRQVAQPRYLLINSGNANAGTGAQGLAAAQQCCQQVAEHMQVEPTQVLPFSTGVIGQQLPLQKIKAAIPALCQSLNDDAWLSAAKAIMTTDTLPKLYSVQGEVNGATVKITGMVKGSGMIRPDMATLLCYVFCDATVAAADLQDYLDASLLNSFHAISVDGDTSTNDACVLSASGTGPAVVAGADMAFQTLLNELMQKLAQAIVRDGEGATKFIALEVEQARNTEEARQVAFTVAHSPLVKSAMFASDPNWGRLLAAIGRAPVTLDMNKLDLYLGEVCLIEKGLPHPNYEEAAGAAVMQQEEISVRIRLGLGEARFTAWTSDLSYEYVRINAEYRS